MFEREHLGAIFHYANLPEGAQLPEHPSHHRGICFIAGIVHDILQKHGLNVLPEIFGEAP